MLRLGLGVAPGGSDPLSIGTVFSISSTGDITKLKNLAYVWPSSHVHGQLHNDGSGNLTWAGLGIGDIQMTTLRLLGRTTAGTGAVEELTAGTSLSLVAASGTLNTIQGIRTTDAPQFARLGLGAAAHASNPLTIGSVLSVDASGNLTAVGIRGSQAIITSGAGNYGTANAMQAELEYNSGNLATTLRSYNRGASVYGVISLNDGALTLSAAGVVNINGLIDSQWVKTDASKNLVSVANLVIGDMQMNTGRLLGRTTGSAGAVEEITPGTSLSFTGLGLNTIQDIRTSASPTFVGLNLSGLAVSRLVATDDSKNLVSVTESYTRKVTAVFAGSSYNDSSDYIDIAHNLGTHDVHVQVRRTKDETGATDATQQRILCDIHAGSYANNADTNKVHLHFGNDPDDDEEFTVVITG
jgi:hypothetical protein